MTLYLFEDTESGEHVELEYDFGTAPACHDEIKREGRTLMRIPAEAEVFVQRDLTNQKAGALVSRSLPLNWKWAPRHDENGRAVFLSHREAQESVKRAKDEGEYVHAYDSPFGK